MIRRRFVGLVGTVGTVAVAGCSETSDAEIESQEQDDSSDENGPERAIEQYFNAAEENDIEALNELVHPEIGGYPLDEEDIEAINSLTLIDTEETSSEQLTGVHDEEDIRQEFEVDEVAWVLATVEEDDETTEVPIVVLKEDGEWLVAP